MSTRSVLSWAAVLSMALSLSPLPAGAAPPEPLRLKAVPEDEGAALRVTVEAPGLPKDAVLTVTVVRQFPVPTSRSPASLIEAPLPLSRDGWGEAVYRMGDNLGVPGIYLVRVSFEEEGQYPQVLTSMAGNFPQPGELVLDRGSSSKAFLQAVLEEQAALAEDFRKAADFRKAWGEASAAEDRDKRLEAEQACWTAWKPRLEEIVTRGRKMRDRFYPETYDRFVDQYLSRALLRDEVTRKIGADRRPPPSGQHSVHPPPQHARRPRPPKDKKPPPPPEEPKPADSLESCEDVFRTETAYYRLAMLNALYQASDEEMKRQAAQPNREAWSRKRGEWNEVLALWSADLGQSGPPKLREVLHREALAQLVPAIKAWWDAEEAQRDALRQGFKDRFHAVLALLQAPPAPPPTAPPPDPPRSSP